MVELHPLMAPALRSTFLVLQPTVYLASKTRLYRPHVVELLGRVVERGDLRDPTRAEMLGLVSEASLVTPPTSRAAALYFRLFRELFPERPDIFEELGNMASSVTRGECGRYPDDVEELMEILRKRMRHEIETTVAGRGKSDEDSGRSELGADRNLVPEPAQQRQDTLSEGREMVQGISERSEKR